MLSSNLYFTLILFTIAFRAECKNCSENGECGLKETCLGGKCVYACKVVNCDVAVNSECVIDNHVAQCKCQDGFHLSNGKCSPGYPKSSKTPCAKNEDCSLAEECYRGTCIFACEDRGCHGVANAVCFARNHEAVCRCKPGFKGNKETGCNRV